MRSIANMVRPGVCAPLNIHKSRRRKCSLWILTAILASVLFPPSAVHAQEGSAAPLTIAQPAVQPVSVTTTLSDPAYFKPDWLNQQVLFTYQGAQYSMPYALLKDIPVTVTVLGNTRTCVIGDTKTIDVFLNAINDQLAALPFQHTEALFDNGAGSYIHRVSQTHFQLQDSVRNWLLTTMQNSLASNVPVSLTQELNADFLTPVHNDPQLSYSSDFVVAGGCTTSYRSSGANRSTNIAVSAGNMNNLVVMPGQTISVSTEFKPRTTANGYKPATVYSGGKSVPGIGGGICQVSSTVYNAVINAGLTIVERHPHSMTVSYLPMGMDATIASGSKDLKFRNDYTAPVILRTRCEDKKVTVEVLAWNQDLQGRSFKLWSKQTGSLSANSYLTTYVDGKEVSTQFVATSRYNPHSTGTEEDAG